MLLYGLPGLPFCKPWRFSSLPVLPRSCPVSPEPFPAFPGVFRFCLCFLAYLSFCSRHSLPSPPAPVPCWYPAARPLHPPASCGQRDGFCGCPLETCRFWTSGHRGPKGCPCPVSSSSNRRRPGWCREGPFPFRRSGAIARYLPSAPLLAFEKLRLSGFFPMMYPSFPNLGPAWPEIYVGSFPHFLSSGRVVIMAYSSGVLRKRSTNGWWCS